MLTPQIPTSWETALFNTTNQPFYHELMKFVDNEYNTEVCFPPKHQIYEALNLCSFDATKIVLLGQDPYHGIGQAHGLAFSVNNGIPFPPSLKNIFKELQSDIGTPIPFSGNLSHWAQQGVLLLNTILTVTKGLPGSHQQKGWEIFTDNIIEVLSKEKSKIVFMLWGAHAQKKIKLIDANKHCILHAGHPSPLSANRGNWFGNKHFSKANAYLEQHELAPIQWEL